MSDATIWEPVDFIALADGLEIHVDEIAMTIGKGCTALATHAWPEDGNEYAICRQVPDGGVIRATPSPVGASVPSEVVEAIVTWIDGAALPYGLSDDEQDYFMCQKRIVRTWLATLGSQEGRNE